MPDLAVFFWLAGCLGKNRHKKTPTGLPDFDSPAQPRACRSLGGRPVGNFQMHWGSAASGVQAGAVWEDFSQIFGALAFPGGAALGR